MGRVGVRSFLGVVGVCFVVCAGCNSAVHAGALEEGGERFFLSVGIGPTVSDVGKFGIRIEDKSQMSIPYNKKNHKVQLHSSNFDWGEASLTPRAQFERKTSGLRAGFGYAVAGVRVELEVEREKSKMVLENRENKLRDGGVPFLLVDDALEYMLGDECDVEKFIDKTAFYERSLSDIGSLLDESDRFAGTGGTFSRVKDIKPEDHLGQFRPVLEAVRNRQGGSTYKKYMDTKKYLLGRKIAEMGRKDRVYFARALAVREKGASVVEVNDVSTTTLTANLCYDFAWVEIGDTKKMSPYACAGIGSSAIGIASNDWRAKVSGKLKAGVNLSLTPEYQVYVGGMYMKVFGNGDYKGIRTERLADDYTPRPVEEDVEEVDTAIISFQLKHYGLEFGARVFF